MKEGRDGAHLIASVKPFQTLGMSMNCILGQLQLIYYILEELIVRRLHSEYNSCVSEDKIIVYKSFNVEGTHILYLTMFAISNRRLGGPSGISLKKTSDKKHFSILFGILYTTNTYLLCYLPRVS